MISGRFVSALSALLRFLARFRQPWDRDCASNFGSAPSSPETQFRLLLLNLYLSPLFVSHPTPSPNVQITIPCSAGTAGAVLSVLLIS